MDEAKSSQIKVNANSPTGITSRAHGSHVDAVAFNISFIASKNPTLALQIMQLYGEAHKIDATDPSYPEEDYSAVVNKLHESFDR